MQPFHRRRPNWMVYKNLYDWSTNANFVNTLLNYSKNLLDSYFLVVPHSQKNYKIFKQKRLNNWTSISTFFWRLKFDFTTRYYKCLINIAGFNDVFENYSQVVNLILYLKSLKINFNYATWILCFAKIRLCFPYSKIYITINFHQYISS